MKAKMAEPFIPSVFVMVTNSESKAQIPVFAVIRPSICRCHVHVEVDPFVVEAKDAFSAVRGFIGQIPVSLMPAEAIEQKEVIMYGPDGISTIKGMASMTANGIITISSGNPCNPGEAWGLAEKLVFKYKTAKKA